MTRLKIKICGLKNQENIREVIKLHPDYIGFIFYAGSKRDATEMLDPDFTGKLDSAAKKTGVFVNDSIERIIHYIALYKLDFVQLHGAESPDFCKELMNHTNVIKAFGIDEHFDFSNAKAYEKVCNYFLFDTKTKQHGGSGNKFNHDLLKNYTLNKKYFLAGGIRPEDVAEIKKRGDKRLHAIDVNSQFELSPGIKDIEKLKKILA